VVNRSKRVRGLAVRVCAILGLLSPLLALPQPAGSADAHVNWDRYLATHGHSSSAPRAQAITQSNAASLTKQWTWDPPTYADRGYPTGTNHIEVSPVVHDGVVYVGTTSGHFYALHEDTGTPLADDGSTSFWGPDGIDLGYAQLCPQKTPGAAVGIGDTATVARDDDLDEDVVYVQSGPGPDPGFSAPADGRDVAGSDGGVYLNAIKTNGTKLWRVAVSHATGSYPWSSPVVFGGHVYVGIASWADCPLVRGGIKEFDQHTGALVHTWWAIRRGKLGAGVWTTPATDGSHLWATTGNGCCDDSFSIVRLDRNLDVLSRWRVPDLDADLDFGSSPTLFTATIHRTRTRLVGGCAKDGYFYAFLRSDLSAGPVWAAHVATAPATQGRCLSGAAWNSSTGLLVVGTPATYVQGVLSSGSLMRLNPATGKTIWQTAMPAPVIGTPTLDGAGVMAAATYGRTSPTNQFALLDAATGAVLTAQDIGATREFGQPVFADDLVLQPTWNGGLSAYSP
jgi:outer membrane protein assembly factor BamB